MDREKAERLVDAMVMLHRKEAELMLGAPGGMKQQVIEATIANCREEIIDILCDEEPTD